MFASLLFTTTLNLGLGLMPYLDNFSHLGGFIAGLMLGFGLLVVKSKYADGTTVGRTFSQLMLGYGCAAALLLMIIISIVLLYANVNVSDWCTFCKNVNCLDIELASGRSLWSCEDRLCPFKNVTYNVLFSQQGSSGEKVPRYDAPLNATFVCYTSTEGTNGRRDFQVVGLQYFPICKNSYPPEEMSVPDLTCNICTKDEITKERKCYRSFDPPLEVYRDTPIKCMAELAVCNVCHLPVYRQFLNRFRFAENVVPRYDLSQEEYDPNAELIPGKTCCERGKPCPPPGAQL
eukprot:g4512.t1